jgi:hypothetical protein
MASKFRRGAVAHDKQGRCYVVEEVEDGIVYCSAENGVETEFPETALVTEAEWQTRHTRRESKRRPVDDRVYDRVRASRVYLAPTGKLDAAAAQQALAKVERLLPGFLDFAAVIAAERALDADGDSGLADLSPVKCREIFDAAKPETRASLVAGLIGSPSHVFVGAARIGDNVMRAMLNKFLEDYGAEFEQFKGAPRK